MAGDLEVVGGIVLALAGVLQVWNATRIHAFFSRRNEGKTRWRQDMRGWSVNMARRYGIAAIAGGLILLLDGWFRMS